jgi:hypothetical protein
VARSRRRSRPPRLRYEQVRTGTLQRDLQWKSIARTGQSGAARLASCAPGTRPDDDHALSPADRNHTARRRGSLGLAINR